MSPILARAATSSGGPWSENGATRIPARRPAQKVFVTLAYTLRRGPYWGAPTPMPVPSRNW